MSKKKRKNTKKNQPKDKPKKKNIIKNGDREIPIVECIECPKENLLIPVNICDECGYRKGDKCLYSGNTITVIGMNTPYKYNRNMFKLQTLAEQEQALNYYMPTKVLEPVKLISREEYPDYHKAKKKFIKGEFRKEEITGQEETGNISSMICLKKTEGEQCDYILNNIKYCICDDKVSGECKMIYYLYDMFTLDGLADIKINDRFYKISLRRIEGTDPDLIVGTIDEYLIIGREAN
jgi:hypothetical protein